MEKTMINIANYIGQVMMAAVTSPRSNKNNNIDLYIKTEFNKDDQAYVKLCMNTNRNIQISNIKV